MTTPCPPAVAELISVFETLTPDTLDRLTQRYAPQARFVDPFNEVVGRAAIRQVFAHMFDTLEAPRFEVREALASPEQAMLIWAFHFTPSRWHPGRIHGSSHLRFDAQGQIVLHRDYWDAAAELYTHLPGIGAVLRALQRRIRAPDVVRDEKTPRSVRP